MLEKEVVYGTVAAALVRLPTYQFAQHADVYG